jgi:glycosyltransferase involved in cell wall biosynthesis
MRLLFLEQFCELGGAQLCLLDLLPGLRREGWEPQAAVAGDGPLTGRLRGMGVPVHELPLRRYSLGRKGALDAFRFACDFNRLAVRIRDLAREIRPDLVYVNGPRLMPAVAHAGAGLPVVFHSHNFITSASVRFLISRAIKRSGALVIAASHFVARQWGGARVVYGGVEGPPPQYRWRHKGPPPRVGMIGRIAPQKGQLQFVAAARHCPGVEFILCGDALFGDPAGERYRDKVLRSAPNSVRWLGWRDGVYEVLSGLDLLVIPSEGEGGVPRVLLEAFAAGVPVLALDSGAMKEAVADGRNGFLLASRAPAGIARRIREILAQGESLNAVADEARRTWRGGFTRRRFVAGVCELLRKYGCSSRSTAQVR